MSWDSAKYRECLENHDLEAVAGMYAEDAVFDLTVGPWRFQRRGPDAVLGQLREDYPAGPPRITRWAERDMAGGVVLEVEECLGEGDDEQFFRYVRLLSVDDAGLIAEDVVYCSGAWDKATVERQRREAPMVRWD